MGSLEKETQIKKSLRSLCLSYGWSFGVFWRFDQRNSLLLTLEDFYSEDYAKSLIDNMFLQVHVLGEGAIGEAALDGNQRWMFSNSSTRKCNFTGHVQIQQDNCDFACEFSSGIKTMVVIPLESCGVLQFGSVHETLETPGFADQARQIFRDLGLIDGLVPLGNSSTSSLITEDMDQSDEFAHLTSCYNSLQSTYLPMDQSEFGQIVSSCTNPIAITNDSIPNSSCVSNQGYSFGFDPVSFLGGSADNQSLDSILHGQSNVQGFDEFNSTEIFTNLLQDQCVDLQDLSLNDDLLQSLVPSSDVDQFSCGFEPRFANVKREESLEDMLYDPMIVGKNNNTGVVGCPSEVRVGSSMVMPKKGLFSELGLDHLLSKRTDSSSLGKSSIEDPIHSPKKRSVECFQESRKCFTADAKSCITDQIMKPQESSRAIKKRAKPGESRRPRPKDRQMIQDRIKELREIIPNGGKCSIDSLLDQTIKHMLFMQGITKYVDKLKRVEEVKAQRHVSNDSARNGSTAWAIEVGGHNPIVVEDLGLSGHMLIEMVCEEEGFFLEIADVIRGFGLTILKGVVEARDGKTWAQFIVESNRHVTRMEVLMSLLQLFKESSTGGSKSFAEGNQVVDIKTSSLLNNCNQYQPMMSQPVGLANTLR